MVKVIKKEVARFRISIYDLKNKTARTISLSNNNNINLDQLKEMIVGCLEKFKYPKDLKKR